MGDRARKGSLTNSHRNERGSSSKTVFDTIVPGLVMVGKDPAGREARKRNDKNREFAREVGASTVADGNFARALRKAGMGPFPVVGMGDQEPPGLDEVGPGGLSDNVMRVGGPGMGGDELRWAGIGVREMGQAVLRGDEHRERTERHA